MTLDGFKARQYRSRQDGQNRIPVSSVTLATSHSNTIHGFQLGRGSEKSGEIENSRTYSSLPQLRSKFQRLAYLPSAFHAYSIISIHENLHVASHFLSPSAIGWLIGPRLDYLASHGFQKTAGTLSGS